MHTFRTALFPVLLVSFSSFGCSKKSADTDAAPKAGETPAESAKGEDTPKTTAPAKGVTCSKSAILDFATKSRPPIQTPVLGVRVPAGGTPLLKTTQLFTIQYLARDPYLAVACTFRDQLQEDKWTIESMNGESPVVMIAKKGKSSVEVMVGPGKGDNIAFATVTPKGT